MRDLVTLITTNEATIRSATLVDEADYDNILWLMETGLKQNNLYPVDKIGRWIGFVQCALIVRGILDTSEARDNTRVIFHAAYLATNQAIPKTLNRH